MKKQSGFTLIELMVVMAIIAILATAGLAAYTGYIKKARDTTRIADLGALNSIVLGDMASDGKPPTAAEFPGVITTANNNQTIKDPLTGKTTCLDGEGTADQPCEYYYESCDSGTGFTLTTRFESASNEAQMAEKSTGDGYYYRVGSCTTLGADTITL